MAEVQIELLKNFPLAAMEVLKPIGNLMGGGLKTTGNILIVQYDDFRDYYGILSNVRKGGTQNFVVSIIDENELVLQKSSTGTGAVRTYKRK
ncbi:hypothetical protein [Treponema pectinovorum]|uniref:hypothetical protein n=1 Tax=Treponema pectinovorum TaxID=164 RepID=UPI0011CC63DE|nr:hypothetical protein [Treponema pectinovorum]